MAKKPKLTPTFADKVAESPQSFNSTAPMPQIATFPASRIVGQMAGQLSAFPPGVNIFGQPIGQSPVAVPQREKVAIIGTAPSSRNLAPFQDLTWDIWGCSPGNMNCLPRVDAWFEIHANLLWPKFINAYGQNYIKWLSEQKFPVYLHDEPWHQKYFPHGIKFPAKELVDKFGRRWFGSSFAWMVAFAIYKGYKEIGLFGVDMASKDEYIQQRQSFYHWMEKCEQLGIKMTIPRESDLAQPPALYGYSDMSPIGRKWHARKDELEGRSEGLAQEIQKVSMQLRGLENNKNYIDGAREDVDYNQSIWGSAQDEWSRIEVSLDAAIAIVKMAGYQVVKSDEPQQPGLKESNHGTLVADQR